MGGLRVGIVSVMLEAIGRVLFGIDKALLRFSHALWPWSPIGLGALFVFATLLDSHSTQLALTLNQHAAEGSDVTRWFIDKFDLEGLALFAIIKIGIYVGVYGGLAYLTQLKGIPGIGRIAFVFISYLYLLTIIPTAATNYVIAFM